MELINFPGQNRSFGRRDSADCKQRAMGQSEVPNTLNESHHSLPQGNPAAVSNIPDNPEKIMFFRIIDYFKQEYQIRQQGFLEADCDGSRSAPSALHFDPRNGCYRAA